MAFSFCWTLAGDHEVRIARNMNEAKPAVSRVSCCSRPSRPLYADSIRPPMLPERPSVFVVWIDMSAMSPTTVMMNRIWMR